MFTGDKTHDFFTIFGLWVAVIGLPIVAGYVGYAAGGFVWGALSAGLALIGLISLMMVNDP